MNTSLIGLGLLSALILIFLIAKSRRGRTLEEIDWEAHNLQITEEGDYLRVSAGGHTYLNNAVRRETFLRQYGEAWSRVRLNFEPVAVGGETLGFAPDEQFNLRQKIALSWVHVYNANGRRFKFMFWWMDSGSRRDVLRAAGAKYGSKSERAIALAAHTLSMGVEEFRAWIKDDEEFQSWW